MSNHSSDANTPSSNSYSSSSRATGGVANEILAPLGVALLVLFIIILAYVFARKRQGIGMHFDETAGSAEEDVDEDDYVGLSEETVKSFPKLLYSRVKDSVIGGQTPVGVATPPPSSSSSSYSCSICLYEYKDTDVIRLLPACNHFFHQGCVDQWLKLHSTCPICRISLTRSRWCLN